MRLEQLNTISKVTLVNFCEFEKRWRVIIWEMKSCYYYYLGEIMEGLSLMLTIKLM